VAGLVIAEYPAVRGVSDEQIATKIYGHSAGGLWRAQRASSRLSTKTSAWRIDRRGREVRLSEYKVRGFTVGQGRGESQPPIQHPIIHEHVSRAINVNTLCTAEP
jgi:hypothetical protein